MRSIRRSIGVVALVGALAVGVFAVQAALASSKGGTWTGGFCGGGAKNVGPRLGAVAVSYAGTPANKLPCTVTVKGTLSLASGASGASGVWRVKVVPTAQSGTMRGTISSNTFHGSLQISGQGLTGKGSVPCVLGGVIYPDGPSAWAALLWSNCTPSQ